MHFHMKNNNRWLFQSLLIMVCISSLFLLGKIDEKKSFVTSEKPVTDIAGEITKGMDLIQSFPCEEDNLERIQILLATFARTNHSTVQFDLSGDGGNVIRQWTVDAAQLKDSSYYTLKLDRKLTDCKGKTYSLHITSDAETGDGITVYKSDEAGATGLTVNGTTIQDTSLCYKLTYRIPLPAMARSYLIRFVIVAVAGVILWALYNIKFGDAGETLPSKEYCFKEGGICKSSKFIRDKRIKDKNKKDKSADNPSLICFFIIWCTLTALYAISNPILNVPDEGGHFMRIYEISEGHFISDTSEFSNSGGRELPFIQPEDGHDMFDINSFYDQTYIKGAEISNQRTYYIFTNTALYSPLTYIPQVTGVTIARLFTKNLYFLILIGRITNWICITILLYFTLKLLPYGKEFFMLAALLPMNLFESFSLSPDGTVVALTSFLIAFVLNIRLHKTCLNIGHYAILYILAVVMCSIKIVYVPFLLYYFLIPADSFRHGMKGKIFHSCICILVVGIISLGWMRICSRFLLMPGTDSKLQVAWIISHPFSYVLMILRYLFDDFGGKMMECIGNILGKRNILIPLTFVLPYYATLVIQYWKAGTETIHGISKNGAMITGGMDKKVSGKMDAKVSVTKSEKYISLLICIIVTLLTITALYIQWNEPYATTLEGLQGRYFIPLLLPLYLLILREGKEKEDQFRLISQCCVILINVCACTHMLFANL